MTSDNFQSQSKNFESVEVSFDCHRDRNRIPLVLGEHRGTSNEFGEVSVDTIMVALNDTREPVRLSLGIFSYQSKSRMTYSSSETLRVTFKGDHSATGGS